MSTPMVPPRPSRNTGTGPTAVNNGPQVPPRPIRKLDPSPSRDTRSPLNELPNPLGAMGKKLSQSNLSALEPPQRPPNISLPSVGQEGLEYASYDQLPPEAHGVSISEADAPEQTRNVSANMPLFAPKASVPQSTAKSRIETVTRTDSTQAAAAGIGRARPDDDVHKTPADSSTSLSRTTTRTDDQRRTSSTEPHPLKQKISFNRSTPTLQPTTSRPESMHEGNHEQGIPEIGMQIPLNPNAGDVQAPSPAPTQPQFAPGIGFYNDGSTRAHNRKRSFRQEFGPPGSYGLHNHGQEPHDKFERDWASKNPDKFALENYNAYGTPRPETALTTAELNRLVTQNSDVGMGKVMGSRSDDLNNANLAQGTDPNMIAVPGEDIAWEATEEYTSQLSSAVTSPAPTTERRKRGSSDTQPTAKSPLRKMSFPFNERPQSDQALEVDDDVVHAEAPEQRVSKVTGGGPVDDKLDLGPRGGNTEERGGWFDERGEGTPILASDEILKRPGSAYMQPAVDPEAERHGDDYYESDHQDTSRRNSLRVPSRPSSRPNSVHGDYQGGSLYRFMSHEEHYGSGMHTPLEEIEEYEPLIPEDEEEPKPKAKAVKRRPGLEHHHFPSQDVWEDTPSSLQYQTTVDTPEPPREAMVAPPPQSKPALFETPEQEQQRKVQNPDDMFSDKKTLIKPHVREDVRPGMQRFPSQDIWEDTPDSMRLVTTVSGPQMDETKSPPDDRPTTTAIPGSQDDIEARATTGFTQSMRPPMPSRPQKKSKLAEEMKPDTTDRDISGTSADAQSSPTKAKAPAIPDRPKPTVPARPARASRGDQADGAELSKSISAEGPASPEATTAPPLPTKAKPAVPARPGGEKIAALKAGFMSDLNNRLKLGPQGPPPKAKEVEPEVAEEMTKAPLEDARKSRAKGPARRKRAASPSATATEDKAPTFSISTPMTLWLIDEGDAVQVSSLTVTPADPEVDLPKLEKAFTENVEQNTAEPTLAEPMSPEKAEARASQTSDAIAADIAKMQKSASMTSEQIKEAVEPGPRTSIAEAESETVSADAEGKELAPATSNDVDTKQATMEATQVPTKKDEVDEDVPV